MARSNPEQREATRQRIIDAFWGLLSERPVTQIKVKAVTDAAGCNRSTFYQYFDSIWDLLDQAEQEVIDDAVETVGAVLDSGGAGSLREPTAQFFERQSDRLTALLDNESLGTFPQRFAEALAPLAVRGLALDPEDPSSHFWAECSIASTTTMLVYWHARGKPVPAEDLSLMILRFYAESPLHAARGGAHADGVEGVALGGETAGTVGTPPADGTAVGGAAPGAGPRATPEAE